ncbi:sulfatase-like hydrolase/transferase [Bremerella sp. JC770]|uniref:sulfatase-like hydrolase/transferase n=1 Tax=Bremerella sp. JC770 TaxID=3232137 RepID=UPI0034590FDA
MSFHFADRWKPIALLLLMFLYVGAGPISAAETPPNVVLIFADDLGYGDLGCYGATKHQTPNIDQLAQEGKRFTDAHSASAVCTPSRYALVTGRYPFRSQLHQPVFLRTGLVIDEDRTSIADVMKRAGYATACIGKWHLGFGNDAPRWNGELKPGPLELGFDYYFGVPVVNSHPPFVYVENHRVVGLTADDPFVSSKSANTQKFPEKMGIDQIGGAEAAHALYRDEAVGTTLTEKSVQWIKANKDHPFFLYLATTNIHHPFTPAPQFQGTSQTGPYGDFVHELDWIVGQVMETLKQEGIDDNTLVIFTSDNGGMLNAGGQHAVQQGHQLNGELLGFKFDAWEGGHRVPWIVRWPGHVKAGSQSDQLVSNIDLLHTFAALTGQQLKPDEGPDSFNVLPSFLGDPEQPVRDHLVIAPFHPSHLALREGPWVYIGGKGGGGFTARSGHALGGPSALKFAGQSNSEVENGRFKKDAAKSQLYRLDTDKSQQTNVLTEHTQEAQRLRDRLSEIQKGTSTRPNRADQVNHPHWPQKLSAVARLNGDQASSATGQRSSAETEIRSPTLTGIPNGISHPTANSELVAFFRDGSDKAKTRTKAPGKGKARRSTFKLDPLFTDHMVLQQKMPVPVWGNASAGASVTVTFAGKTSVAQTNAQGEWQVNLSPLAASSEPREMTIVCDSKSIVLKDVLVGEVWLGSGQSNMQYTMQQTEDGRKDIPQASHPLLRIYKRPSGKKVAESWHACSPDVVQDFSAVAYYFGRHLQEEQDVPVGLIVRAVGGTTIQRWVAPNHWRTNEYLDQLAQEAERRGADIEQAASERDKYGKRNPPPPEKAAWLAELGNLAYYRNAGGLYQRMIKPLQPFAVRGVIWYQGEFNNRPQQAYDYRELQATLVEGWRKEWGQGDFPFLFVQMQGLGNPTTALLRESQATTLARCPNTAMAVICDQSYGLHPERKQIAGTRLAKAASSLAYGASTSAMGPTLRDAQPRGSKVLLTFNNCDDGLQSKNGDLNGFFIAGGDQKFQVAQAKITGKNEVTVWSDNIRSPVAVRYAWLSYPEDEMSLFNSSQLPASPFRTDNWDDVDSLHRLLPNTKPSKKK